MAEVATIPVVQVDTDMDFTVEVEEIDGVDNFAFHSAGRTQFVECDVLISTLLELRGRFKSRKAMGVPREGEFDGRTQ